MATPIHPIRVYRLTQTPPITLDVLAKKLGTKKPNLSRIENRLQRVSEALLPKIVAETGIPAAILRPDLAKLFKDKRGRRAA
jgi:transcriptional regulator with XRE-family HTH domain